MKRCQCCGKLLEDVHMIDTCMCRPPYCEDCGYCSIHDQFYVAHSMVHTNRIEVRQLVDDTNQEADNQQVSQGN